MFRAQTRNTARQNLFIIRDIIIQRFRNFIVYNDTFIDAVVTIMLFFHTIKRTIYSLENLTIFSKKNSKLQALKSRQTRNLQTIRRRVY